MQRTNWEAVRSLHFIGLDGTLLQLIAFALGHRVRRTSADLFIPELLREFGPSRMAIVGGKPGVAERASGLIDAEVVFCCDGYGQLAALRSNPAVLHKERPDIVIVALGAELQDLVLVELMRNAPEAIWITAGGYLDQLCVNENYFPRWVHRFRLGWALRIMREPRRLVGRYTLAVVRLAFVLHNIERNIFSLAVVPGESSFAGEAWSR
ncbi:glycosyltransferase [Gordonia polyisoprenivorans]|uniref:Glycosyltransferase n=1 Tax=Gordonia polyisoprenivorans TaxID=84595 RepID=A0A846WHP6_9ACTN|nr:glycosyltransferase [Gordonia polyisoprenivorans]